MEKTKRIDLLDYLRGIMALSVLVYHFTEWSNFHYVYPIDQVISRLGIYAVSAFYLLSGTSLAVVYFNKRVNGEFLKEFAIKRIFRIAPLFYVATTLTLILIAAQAFLAKDFSQLPSVGSIILNYTLTFGWLSPHSYIATGAWSIGNELVFYSFFPIMLFLKNKSLKHYAVFFVLTIVSTIAFTLGLTTKHSLASQWNAYINPINQLYFFAGGFLIGTLVKKGMTVNKKVLGFVFVIALILFVIAPFGNMNQITMVTGFPKIAFSLSVFAFCFVAAFWGDAKQNILTKGLKYLGDVSYSVYLFHPVVYKGVNAVFTILHISNSKIIVVFVSLVGSLIISTMSYYWLEKYFMNLGRKVINRKKSLNETQIGRAI